VRREDLLRLVRLLVLATAILNAVALVEFALARAGLLDIPFVNYGTTRLSGLLVDPNAYGGLLVAVLFIALGAQRAGWLGLPALLAPATFLSLAAGIALTSSRSAWVAAAIGVLLLLVMAPKRALGSVSLIAVSLLAIALLTGPAFLEEAATLATRRPQIESRLDFLELAGREFAHRPVLGLGVGYFEATHGMIVHNTPAWLLFEAGVVGLGLYLAVVAHALWQGAAAWRLATPSDRAGLLGLLTGFAAMLGLSLGIEALYQRHWWVLFAWLEVAPLAFRRDG
jgi:O-antigen ligase